MIYTIPFTVDEDQAECKIELLDLAQQNVLEELFCETKESGPHTVKIDPDKFQTDIDAGVYVLRLTVGNNTQSFPLRYMP